MKNKKSNSNMWYWVEVVVLGSLIRELNALIDDQNESIWNKLIWSGSILSFLEKHPILILVSFSLLILHACYHIYKRMSAK